MWLFHNASRQRNFWISCRIQNCHLQNWQIAKMALLNPCLKKFFGGQKTSGTISENSTTRLVLVCFIGAVVNHPNNLILTVALPSASRVHAVVVYKKRSDSVEIQMNKFPNFDCLDGQSANQRMEIHLTNSTLIDQGNTKRKTCKTAMLPGFCMIEKWWQQRQHW